MRNAADRCHVQAETGTEKNNDHREERQLRILPAEIPADGTAAIHREWEVKMKIKVTETIIEADARELRESNTLAGNFANLLSRIFQSTEPFETEPDEDPPEE